MSAVSRAASHARAFVSSPAGGRNRRARRNSTRRATTGATGETTFRDAPFKVVITGSTKGLGLELARGFLANGDEVVVTSRDETRVREAVDGLRTDFGERVSGVAADVSRAESVDAGWGLATIKIKF